MAISTSSSVNSKSLVFANDIVVAVQNIMNSSANLTLDASNPNDETEKKYPSFMTGMMVLHGERNLVLTLTFSKEAVADIVVSLLGVKYNQIEENDAYDIVMETTNMVAGRIKSAAISLGTHLDLSTPMIFIGYKHFIGTNSRPECIVKKFKDKKFEMLASVFFL